jgi:hypothetical protein
VKKSGGPRQTRAEVKLPSTQWIPWRVAIEYLQRRLRYSAASAAELLRSALLDGQVKIRFEKDNPAMLYGHDHQTAEGATLRDLFFKRDSLEVWAEKIAPDESEQDDRKARAKSGADEEILNQKSKASMQKMILGMAKARYGYDPNSHRNKAIAEITADLDRLGLGLSEDTVRRWLREAVDSLPRIDIAES